MTLFIGVNLYTLFSVSLQDENTVTKEKKICTIYQHSDNSRTKTIDFLIANRKAQIPQKILFIQTQKNLDCKFLPVTCIGGENIAHRPPHELGWPCIMHSKHPYTQLNHTYYLYTLKKILI